MSSDRARIYGCAGDLWPIWPLFGFGRAITPLPAEGAEHEAARGDKLGDAANKAREAAIVKRIVASGKSAVLVLGGGHDLTEAIKPTGWGYVRVTPKGYPE